MNKFNVISTLLAINILLSCNNSSNTSAEKRNDSLSREKEILPDKSYSDINKINWLTGSWKNNIGMGYSIETWTRENDSTLKGVSYMIAGIDTLSRETVSLQQRGTALFYIPTVQGQNNNQPVPFTLSNAAGDKLVFENQQHDFPQKITYTKISADSIVAQISGVVDKKEHVQTFPMRRMN